MYAYRKDALTIEKVKMARAGLSSLILYRGIRENTVVKALSGVLDAVYGCVPGEFIDAYCGYLRVLADSTGDFTPRRCLEDAFIYDKNGFAKNPAAAATGIRAAVLKDIEAARLLGGLTSREVKNMAAENFGGDDGAAELIEALPDWDSAVPADSLLFAGEANEAFEKLTAFYTHNGYGEFARWHAFSWTGENGGWLKPVKNPDPIRLSDLKGYEYERGAVLENTLDFINGFRANNMLLYGDRGTGKSSTVKAVFNEYSGRGLRIVEISKDDLYGFPALIAAIAQVPLKFVIFIDDLSFNGDNENVSALKAVLEGSMEARPQNMVIYATSNRRHLVRESFSERQNDDVHAADNMQEKLSLSDRFGITVTFSAPDQKMFLTIVNSLARDRGLSVDTAKLERGAIQWALTYNGRSPRAAKQYIDWLEGRERKDDKAE